MSWLNAGGGFQKKGGLRAKFKVAQAMDYTQQVRVPIHSTGRC